MPRTKKNPDEVLELELRITPWDNEPIVDWKLTDDHLEFIAYQEGGNNTDKALHYHCYIKYMRSRTLLIKWIYSIATSDAFGPTGNAVFFSRKPHEHTMGYISKHNVVACRKNITDQRITQWFQESEDYRRTKETKRKRDQRSRKEIINRIMEHIKKGLHDNDIPRNVGSIIDRLCAEFTKEKTMLPTRTEMERFVLSLMNPYDQYYVRSYYGRFLINN